MDSTPSSLLASSSLYNSKCDALLAHHVFTRTSNSSFFFPLVTFQCLKENFLIWTHFSCFLFCFIFFFQFTLEGGMKRRGRLRPCYFLFVFVLENADHLCLSKTSLQPSWCWFWYFASYSPPPSFSLNNFPFLLRKLLSPSLNLSSWSFLS